MVSRGRVERSGAASLAVLLLLVGCRGRKAGQRDGGASDGAVTASVIDAGAVTTAEDARAPVEIALAPAPSSPSEAEHIRRAKEACAQPIRSSESAVDMGYALLADGKRSDAIRTLRNAIHPPEASPVADEYIHDGIPDGYEAAVGPNGLVLVSGAGKEWSYLFRGGTLLRRVRGRAELVPRTDLLRAVDGPGMTLVRLTTGDVVFRAFSTDAFAWRPGAAAVVHTRCDGGQELVVFSGASSARTLATTLDPRNALEPRPQGTAGPDELGWSDDDRVWIRGKQSSFVFDVAKNAADPPPKRTGSSEMDWGIVTPRVDPKRNVAVAHYGSPGALDTTLFDWRERAVLRRVDAGPRGASEPTTRFSDDGERFAMLDGACELLVFKTGDLTSRRIALPCGEDKAAPSFRFWPRSDTLLFEAPRTVSIVDANSGESLASWSYSALGRAQLTGEGTTPNALLVVEDCVVQGGRGRQIQLKIGRDLRTTKTDKPGTCGADAGAEKRGPEGPLASLSNGVCTVDTVEGLLPREVCAQLRAENKDGGAPSPGKGISRGRRPKR